MSQRLTRLRSREGRLFDELAEVQRLIDEEISATEEHLRLVAETCNALRVGSSSMCFRPAPRAWSASLRGAAVPCR